MNRAKGGSLYDYVSNRSTPLTDEEARKIFTQFVYSFDCIHRSGVVCVGNLTPKNIFFNEDHSVIKMSDFSKSRVLTADGYSGDWWGTPDFFGLLLLFI